MVTWEDNSAAIAANATTVTLAVTNPVNAAVDDILICIVLGKDNQVHTFPANWNKFVEQNNTTAQRMTIAWKRCLLGDIGASFNITKPTDNNILFCAAVMAFRGCTTTATPIDATTPSISPNASSTTISFATFDPTETNAYVVAASVYNLDQNSPGNISGTNPTYTLYANFETPTGTDGAIYMHAGSSDGAATGARSFASGGTAAINIGVQFGLVAAPATNIVQMVIANA